MTFSQFAKQFVKDHPGCKVVYIAIIPNNESGFYDLEVEVSHDTIGATWATDTGDARKGRKEADKLDKALGNAGVEVIATREEWDEYQPCGSCGQMVNLEDGIDCTECEDRFCDSCYDTGKGDGCHCHPKPPTIPPIPMPETQVFVVPVTFQGEIEVVVPTSVPELRRRALAEKIATARILATLDNPDAPEDDASEEYAEQFGLDEELAGEEWDACQTDSVSGSWKGGKARKRTEGVKQ